MTNVPITGAGFAPMDSVYRTMMQDALGFNNPWQRAYAQTTMPMQQLAYLTDTTFTPTGVNTNPFQSYLETSMANPFGSQVLSTQEWMNRAQAVQNALNLTGNQGTAGQMKLQERFGGGEGRDPNEVARQQASLANAAIMSNTPLALRGETANILSRFLDRYLTQGATGNYLQTAMNPGGVWEQFGLAPDGGLGHSA